MTLRQRRFECALDQVENLIHRNCILVGRGRHGADFQGGLIGKLEELTSLEH